MTVAGEDSWEEGIEKGGLWTWPGMWTAWVRRQGDQKGEGLKQLLLKHRFGAWVWNSPRHLQSSLTHLSRRALSKFCFISYMPAVWNHVSKSFAIKASPVTKLRRIKTPSITPSDLLPPTNSRPFPNAITRTLNKAGLWQIQNFKSLTWLYSCPTRKSLIGKKIYSSKILCPPIPLFYFFKLFSCLAENNMHNWKIKWVVPCINIFFLKINILARLFEARPIPCILSFHLLLSPNRGKEFKNSQFHNQVLTTFDSESGFVYIHTSILCLLESDECY